MRTPLQHRSDTRPGKYILLAIALAPVLPQVIGSAFNIWYNIALVDPLLRTTELKERFLHTIILYNSLCYPLGVYVWLRLVYSLWPAFRMLQRGEEVPPAILFRAPPARHSAAVFGCADIRRRLAALYSRVSFVTPGRDS